MPKFPRHPVNLKLSTLEFAALTEDADKFGIVPAAMAPCNVLAGMRRFWGVPAGHGVEKGRRA